LILLRAASKFEIFSADASFTLGVKLRGVSRRLAAPPVDGFPYARFGIV